MMSRNVSKAVATRDVYLMTSLSAILVHKDICHVPDIRLSLILVGKLDDNNYFNFLDNS